MSLFRAKVKLQFSQYNAAGAKFKLYREQIQTNIFRFLAKYKVLQMRSPIFKIDKGNSARSEIDKTNFKIQFTLGCCEDNIFDFLIQLSVTIRRGFGPETYNEFC